jgi:AhpD family alkylhydroperoxidase
MTGDATAARTAPIDALVTGPRTYTPRGWAADAARLVSASPRLLAIYGRTRVDEATRERVMVAVSRANACAACTRVHEAWALRAGVSAAELQQIGAGELSEMPAGQRAAIVYATALAEARFGPVPEEVAALVDVHLDPDRQRDIETIARLMTFANLTVNSLRVLTGRA